MVPAHNAAYQGAKVVKVAVYYLGEKAISSGGYAHTLFTGQREIEREGERERGRERDVENGY
jgi:hypothetical protein